MFQLSADEWKNLRFQCDTSYPIPALFLQQEKIALQDLPLKFWRRVLDEFFMPICAPYIVHPDDSWHGVQHAWQTARFAALIAKMHNVSPLEPMLAACLHDAARDGMRNESRHGEDSAKLAQKVFFECNETLFHLDTQQQERIITAIASHSALSKTEDSVAACLRDADRLRLGWLYGVREDLISTTAGLRLAQAGAEATNALLTLCEVC